MDPTDGVGGWVSVPTSALQSIDLRHVASAVDVSIAIPCALGPLPPGNVITGYTQWAGVWHDGQIYVDWDWGLLRDVVIILDPGNIRTNIKLVMDGGNAIAPLLARVHLYEWIESLPWRAIGIEELIERHGR